MVAVVKRNATVVVTVCEQMRRQLAAYGFSTRKLVPIYNGVNVERHADLAPGTLRVDAAIPADATLVGMVANVRECKGYEFFVQAAERVLARFPETQFVAVGDIDCAVGAPISKLVRERGLEERERFVGFRSDIPEVLADLDLFVLSSLSEGFPLVLLEAMASRCAVVATQYGGIGEMIEDGGTGRLVPVADATRLADAIL
jgi:glycosyltransferase involved in cell wall biosynthesis